MLHHTMLRKAWRMVEGEAGRRGYDIAWRPAPLRAAGGRLEVSLEFVLPHLLLCKRMPFFIEIGANDGRSNDPLYPFIAEGLITGIALEPVPEVFAALQATYAGNPNVRCVNAALAAQDGEAEFFTVDMTGIAFRKAQQFSSFRRESLLGQTSWVPDIADRIIATTVATVSFATLQRMAAEAGAETVDILHTDTEGFDSRVLDMMWESGLAPAVVNFEKLLMSKDEISRQVSRLAAAGYMAEMGDSDIIAYRPPRRFGYR